MNALLKLLSLTLVLCMMACQSEQVEQQKRTDTGVRRCEVHGTELQKITGWVKDPMTYHIYPINGYYKMIEANPHFDRGLMEGRQKNQTGEFSFPWSDWVCERCTKEGLKGMEDGKYIDIP